MDTCGGCRLSSSRSAVAGVEGADVASCVAKDEHIGYDTGGRSPRCAASAAGSLFMLTAIGLRRARWALPAFSVM